MIGRNEKVLIFLRTLLWSIQKAELIQLHTLWKELLLDLLGRLKDCRTRGSLLLDLRWALPVAEPLPCVKT